ncbi:MAG: DNA polymerase I [Candidatus Schekmanbacteria bacterium]|nr:DNA polymerase I [Candidatus Schekmanbacteria bacterium]
MPNPRLILIDGSGYFYRAFFAIRYLANSQGLPTNAVYGFTRMLLKVIREEQPDYLAMVYDSKGPTFRHEQYAEYKSQRPPMPDDLVRQLPYIKRVVEALSIAGFELPGYEADDLIGTLAGKAVAQGMEVVIISGDKDIWQLVNDKVQVYDEIRGEHYNPETVTAKLGVKPSQVIDVMALAGDSSDNIPGVPGIGIKTAVSLIQKFDTLENLLANIPQVSGKACREKLAKHTQEANLSRQLVTINTQAPVELDSEKVRYRPPDYSLVAPLFQELEFFSLLEQLAPKSCAAASQTEVEHITTAEQLEKLTQDLAGAGNFAFDIQFVADKAVGIAIALSAGKAGYIPLAHDGEQLAESLVVEKFKPLWENPRIGKATSDLKAAYKYLIPKGINLAGELFEPAFIAYLLNSSRSSPDLAELTQEYLNYILPDLEKICGKGSSKLSFSQIPVVQAGQYSGEICQAVWQLAQKMPEKLIDAGLSELLYQMEIPLAKILADMERVGIKIDTAALAKMSRELEQQLKGLETRIHFFAGEQFNIDSPKQLSAILFERLGLPTIKRTKTGFSTDSEVLQELSLLHPIVAELLEYRKLAKLKYTYVDSIPQLINPATGRLHTTFNQTGTATGRLSSNDPNLQNIPIRGELGTQIRRAFIPEPGYRLISADYSQIELRLMAHFSEDDKLIEAFINGEDIHQRTAMEVFQTSSVKTELRRRAKAINFGILYGMSAFGLGKEINVGTKEAQRYIDSYFARYPQVRLLIEAIIAKARHDGYTTTLFGRRRYIPELQAKDKQTRQLGERMAINSPIQGSAADIIKLAMIKVQDAIEAEKLGTRILLQIHDELLFEVPETEVEKAQSLIKPNMEGVVNLLVPLTVEIKTGDSWGEI